MKHKSTELVRGNMGEVRLSVYTVRSTLAPQWWEFRRRFHWWRIEQRVKSNRKMLSAETQAALAWAEEAIANDFLYGRENW